MDNKLISVIVPVYKVEPYLDRCVESIINQTYKNLEIILVDDGSPDSCPAMCDEWAEKDKRICVIHKENGGLSDARNAGLEIARGTWISFVDSDDYLSENMLEALYKRCIEDESDMAVCNCLYVYENGKDLPKKHFDLPITDVVSKKHIEKLIWTATPAWGKLCKNFLFDGIRFPVGKIHEDEFVTYRLYDKCQRVSIINETLYFYTQRSDSIMGQPYSVLNLDFVEAYIEQTEYFIKTKKENCAVHQLSVSVSAMVNAYKKLDLKISKNKDRYEELKSRFKIIYFQYRQNYPIKLNVNSVKGRIKCRIFFIDERILSAIENLKNLIKNLRSMGGNE